MSFSITGISVVSSRQRIQLFRIEITPMTMRFIVSIAIFACFVYWGEALRCAPCDREKFCREEPTECPYGFSKNVCNCCIVCAKGPGEKCGGLWNTYGSCGTGLKCYPLDLQSNDPGKCISDAP